jgi:hypothetical protein
LKERFMMLPLTCDIILGNRKFSCIFLPIRDWTVLHDKFPAMKDDELHSPLTNALVSLVVGSVADE